MAENMTADFDPADRNSWYFGRLGRSDTNNLLASECCGVFLVRDSTSIKGDLVLCVKEDDKVSHYIINKINVAGTMRYRIGDQEFPDIPSLLLFYKTHYLDTTSLIRPATREKYIAKFDFPGKDPEDLPFKKDDILLLLQKDEDEWWTAKNSNSGKTGLIPVPYIQKYHPGMYDQVNGTATQQTPNPNPSEPVVAPPVNLPSSFQNGQRRQLPARARVIQQRIPCAYDTTALRLNVGDEILVTAMNIHGQWEGETDGKKGSFPFTHVKFIDSDNEEENSLD